MPENVPFITCLLHESRILYRPWAKIVAVILGVAIVLIAGYYFRESIFNAIYLVAQFLNSVYWYWYALAYLIVAPFICAAGTCVIRQAKNRTGSRGYEGLEFLLLMGSIVTSVILFVIGIVILNVFTIIVSLVIAAFGAGVIRDGVFY